MSEQETWLLAAVALLTPPIGLVVFNVLFLRVCLVEETVGESLENYLEAMTKIQQERMAFDKRLLGFRRSRLGLSKAMMDEAAEGAEEGSLAARTAASETTDAEEAAAEAAAAHDEHAKAERLDMLRSLGISVPEDEAEVANGGAASANGRAAVSNGGSAASNGAVAVPAGIASAANGGSAASNGAVAVPAGIASAANGEPPGAPAPDRVADGSGKISLLKALAAEPTSWPGGGGLDAEPPGPVDPKSEAELGGAIRRMMSGGEPEDS